MPKKKSIKKPPEKTVKNTRQAADKSGSRNTSKAKGQSTPPPEKLSGIQKLLHRLKALIYKKKFKARDEFRYNLDTKHPQHIFGEQGDTYYSSGITHEEKTFGKKNMPLTKNPQKGKSDKAYIRNGTVKGNKKSYGKRTLKDFEFSPADKANVKSKERHIKKALRKKGNKKSK